MKLTFQDLRQERTGRYAATYEALEDSPKQYLIFSDDQFYNTAPDFDMASLLVDCWNAVHDGDLGAIAEARAKVRAL